MNTAQWGIPAARCFEPYRSFIPSFPEFLEGIKGPGPRDVRIGTLKADPDAVRRGLFARGLVAEEHRGLKNFHRVEGEGSPGHWPEYSLGLVHSQALSSGIASLALGVRPGHRVLDLCAAPGSKTTHLAELMGNTGLIVANDKSLRRLVALRHNIKRLGVLNTVTTCYRGENFPRRVLYHRVLVDAPCSGEGLYRSDETGNLKSRPPARPKLYGLQKRLILKGFDLLLPRGVMVYSTCTYNPKENEEVVAHLLENRDAELLPLDLPLASSGGLTEHEGAVFPHDIQRCARLYPHRNGTVGFFLARIGKRG